MPGPYISTTVIALNPQATETITIKVNCTPTPQVPDCRAVVTQAVQAALDAYPDGFVFSVDGEAAERGQTDEPIPPRD